MMTPSGHPPLRMAPSGIGRSRVRIELQDDDVLFFVHIPKTGGMSLISVLERQFRPDEIFPPHSFIGPEGFEAYGPLRRSRFKLVRAHLHAGSYSYVARYIAPNPLCLTLLRDPVERLVSAYKHILRFPDNPLHAELANLGDHVHVRCGMRLDFLGRGGARLELDQDLAGGMTRRSRNNWGD